MDYLRPLWTCLQTFCSCFNCAEELGNQGYETNERTHLLVDAVHSSPALRRSNSDNISNEYAQSLPKKDDQNALCRLVQNTAINMIDVGAMDAHNLEHQEYNDRIKLYSQRLQQQWSKVHNPSHVTMGLLRDMPNSAGLTCMPAIEDIQQMRNVLQKAQVAVADIKIEHKEEVVVPFRIP